MVGLPPTQGRRRRPHAATPPGRAAMRADQAPRVPQSRLFAPGRGRVVRPAPTTANSPRGVAQAAVAASVVRPVVAPSVAALTPEIAVHSSPRGRGTRDPAAPLGRWRGARGECECHVASPGAPMPAVGLTGSLAEKRKALAQALRLLTHRTAQARSGHAIDETERALIRLKEYHGRTAAHSVITPFPATSSDPKRTVRSSLCQSRGSRYIASA